MKPITLRNIPPPLAKKIETRASRSGASLNQTTIEMLAESERPVGTPQHDLDRFAGTWSAEEADAFDAELAAVRTIVPETEA